MCSISSYLVRYNILLGCKDAREQHHGTCGYCHYSPREIPHKFLSKCFHLVLIFEINTQGRREASEVGGGGGGGWSRTAFLAFILFYPMASFPC